MAKYTREQVNKWNAGMQNGFTTDLRALLYHGEKKPSKYITLPDGKLLQASLTWMEQRDPDKPSWAASTGLHEPTLHLSKWEETGTGLLSSRGLGVYITIGDAQKKRMFNVLQQLTARYPDAECIKLYEANKHTNMMSWED